MASAIYSNGQKMSYNKILHYN